jgi:hypothetical protein
MAPPSGELPAPGGNPVTLALFNVEEMSLDIEVYGQLLNVEVDPADVLELFLQRQPVKIVSRKPVLAAGGIVGDLVVTWTHEEKKFMGRFVAVRFGPRLIILWFRSPEEQYGKVADAIFIIMSSLRMAEDRGVFAESMQVLTLRLPVPWKMVIPEAWQVNLEGEREESASFQANLKAEPEKAESLLLAQLSVSVIANSQVTSYEFGCSNILGAMREAGVALAPTSRFLPAPVAKPYVQLWHLTTDGSLQGQAVTVHARLLQHEKAWVAAAVVGPTREGSAVLWMRAKRVLDVACMTLEIGGVEVSSGVGSPEPQG